jgi:hypothetical protein
LEEFGEAGFERPVLLFTINGTLWMILVGGLKDKSRNGDKTFFFFGSSRVLTQGLTFASC